MAVSINRVLDRFYTGLYTLQVVLLLSISSVSLAGPFDGGNKKNGKVLHVKIVAAVTTPCFLMGWGLIFTMKI